MAVVGVIANHLGLYNIRIFYVSAFGWTGVELFFVLSGFLITYILLVDRNRNRYYSTFYSRRALRIFPIYYLVFLSLLVASLLCGQSVTDWPIFATYTQNWLYAFSDTWTNDDRIHFSWGAAHTWSLAVEEQFYLLWPVMVRKLSIRYLGLLTILLILVGPTSRYVALALTGRFWSAYTPLFCQVDMLAWGALGAIIYSENLFQRYYIEFFAKCCMAFGVTMITFVFFRYGAGVILSPWSLKGQLFFASLGPFYLSLLAVAMSGGFLTRTLEAHPIRYCGRISYGLYLYHWPVLLLFGSVVGTNFDSGRSILFSSVIILVGTFIIAAASYRWIESPILKAKDRVFPRRAATGG
jgi:peptidoglycan/LPS O-acetylase OafA/YrhL